MVSLLRTGYIKSWMNPWADDISQGYRGKTTDIIEKKNLSEENTTGNDLHGNLLKTTFGRDLQSYVLQQFTLKGI